MAKKDKRDIVISSVKGVKMHDAGEKRTLGVCCDGPASGKSQKTRIDYPSMYLNNKQVPELSGMEVGTDVVLVVRAKVVSHSQRDHRNMSKEKRNRETFDLEVTKIGVVKK